ncbi:MAG TPA: cytochrome c [Pyrinomonadaceae bacterium]|jgi:mono/diheme cytochrome c family protein|nr:cytochrome c [Pyrinomonadaceae bacterium]
MKPIKLVILFAALTLFAIACNDTTTRNQTGNNSNAAGTATPSVSPATSATPADEFAAIRPVYAAECARCHGINGDGGTVEILKKKLKVPSLKTGHALNHTEAQLAKQIMDGGEGMPAYRDKLKKEEVDTLVRLIRKEFQAGAPARASSPAPPGK